MREERRKKGNKEGKREQKENFPSPKQVRSKMQEWEIGMKQVGRWHHCKVDINHKFTHTHKHTHTNLRTQNS